MKNIVPKPKIGILSGVGPLAGSDVFAKLLQVCAEEYGAVEDNEYPDVVLINHGVEGVDNMGTLSNQFEVAIIDIISQLEENNSTVIGMACNTAHIYLDKIDVKPNTQLINLIEEVTKCALEVNDNYLLLTSKTSKEQKLYQNYLKSYGVDFQEINNYQQELLDKIIGLVMAHKLEEAGIVMTKILKSAKDLGISSVIAGCTELPIAINNAELAGITVIDSNKILAQSLAAAYYKGEK